MEGFFADPIYGGNRDMAGWKLVGFPGVRDDFRDVMEKPNQVYMLPPVGMQGRSAWGRELMARRLPRKDVVIVGLGWTGSILAHELARTGLNIVAIERGPWRDTATDFHLRPRSRRVALPHPARSVPSTRTANDDVPQ